MKAPAFRYHRAESLEQGLELIREFGGTGKFMAGGQSLMPMMNLRLAAAEHLVDIGGIAQGIGNALYEEIPYDENGQPLATTFADYLLPGAPEIPHIKIGHMCTPSPHTEYGMKGMGEGGAISPPAAIANAIRDALLKIGAELNETPMTPRRVRVAIEKALMNQPEKAIA